MKHLPNIAAGLLGLAFITFGMNHFFQFLPAMPAPPEGSPPALFFGAIYPTGYFSFIKVIEILGGIMVIIPMTRNIGLLFLGPIIINILAFHIFLTNGGGLTDPPVLAISILAAYLLWCGRRSFLGLMKISRD